MPQARNYTKVCFTLPPRDSEALGRLAELISEAGGGVPNRSQAVRIAVREALEKREKKRGKSRDQS